MGMKILLKKRVLHVGRAGDVVEVRSGFGRNFLLPQGLAVEATPQTMQYQARLKAEAQKQADEDRQQSEALVARIGDHTRKLIVKVDPEGHMYGSVSSTDILKLLADEGIELERRVVQLLHPIKKTGIHSIPLRFPEDVRMELSVRVMAEGAVEEEQSPSSEPLV